MVFDDVLRIEQLNLRGSLENLGVIYPKKQQESKHVIAQRIRYKTSGVDSTGVILFYENPPRHQLSDEGLAEHMGALEVIAKNKRDYDFLIVFGRNHPYHAGADIKENYERLRSALEGSKLPEYLEWSGKRLSKFVGMVQLIDEISQSGVVSVSIASGLLFGGSAEKTLMLPYIVGDSRWKIQLSEPTLGIMPVVGIYLIRRKTTQENTASIALTAEPFKAQELYGMGIVNRVIQIDGRYVDPHNDESGARQEDNRTHSLIFPATLDFIVDALQSPDKVKAKMQIQSIMDKAELERQIASRINSQNYLDFQDVELRDAQKNNSWPGKPLFRPSINSIQSLLSKMNGLSTEELLKRRDKLLDLEKRLDLDLYEKYPWDILIGFKAALNGKVAIFDT